MNRFRRSFLQCWLVLIALAGDTSAASALSPYEAVYKANINGLPVTITSTLETTAEGYRISTAADNFLGELREHERFHLAGEQILVDEYEHRRALLGSQRLERLVVDRRQGIARYRRDDRASDIPLTPDLLGPMSYQVQLRRDLAAGGTEFSYRVMHRGKVKEYHFEREGTESVALPSGAVEAVRVRRVRDDNDRETVFWMAPTFDFQLIKLRQIEEGERYELLLAELRTAGAAGDRE